MGLVFSKDRAMQLQAVLDSLRLHLRDPQAMRLTVLFRASTPRIGAQYQRLKSRYPGVAFIEETDFRAQTLAVVRSSQAILFLVDDNLFVGDWSIGPAVTALHACPRALGFSLRLGSNITYSYMKNQPLAVHGASEEVNGILRFDWTRQSGDFAYPFDLSSSMYRSGQIIGLLEQLPWANPNQLEGAVAAQAAAIAGVCPELLSFGQSVTLCVPVNLVQTVCLNRSGNRPAYSVESLADRFDAGQSIDVAAYSGLVPSSCHQELELSFVAAPPPAPSPSSAADSKPVPPVSVEMVAYNAERFIERAIRSVLKQTFRDFELLIVDDGSTDATWRIIESIQDPRIQYIACPHRGAASARNRAIAAAGGRYILTVDSDDAVAPDYLEAMVAHAEQYPDADYYYPAGLTLVDEFNQPTGAVWRYDEFTDGRALVPILFSLGKSVIPKPGGLVRRSLYERTGGYPDVQTAEDFGFFCRNAGQIRFCRVPNSAPYYYRVGAGGLSRKFQQRNEITAVAMEEMIARYPAEVLCPQLSQCNDPTEQTQLYYEYLMMTFCAHAQTNAGRFGEPFVPRGDRYRARLLESLAASGKTAQSVWGMTGVQRTTAMYRRGVERLTIGRPDEALVYFDEVRRGGAGVAGIDYARAVAFLKLGRPDQAVAACQAELRLNYNPDAERLLAQLGQPASVQRTGSDSRTEIRSVSTM